MLKIRPLVEVRPEALVLSRLGIICWRLIRHQARLSSLRLILKPEPSLPPVKKSPALRLWQRPFWPDSRLNSRPVRTLVVVTSVQTSSRGSTSETTWKPSASELVWLNSPAIARTSPSVSSSMPCFFRIAVWELTQ